MKLIIFGPQGSGKGTQAELIARRRNIPYISTGDIFRYNLKQQTGLGEKIAEYVNQGLLVPDELTNEVVNDRLNQPDCVTGFILDGYPRNQFQLDFLIRLHAIDWAVVIELDDLEAIKRLGGRLACKCGLSYHLQFNPPTQPNICNKCGGELFKREDDQAAAIKQRLAIYHEQTEPLINFFDQQHKLILVNGNQSIEDVYQEIDKKLAAKEGRI